MNKQEEFRNNLKVKKTNTDKQIDKIMDLLSQQIRQVSSNKELDILDIAEQGDVLLNTMKFLQNYRENIQILNKYEREKNKKFKER